MSSVPKTILEEAQEAAYGDRHENYGHPIDNFQRIAALWEVILGTKVSPKNAALCMCAVKISRELHTSKRDNLVDLAGYADVVARIQEREDEGS